MSKQRYRLTNSTRKPKPQNKMEQVGFLVGVNYFSGGRTIRKDLAPGESVLSEELSESHLQHQKAGNLTVKVVDDVSVLLKSHASAPAPQSQQQSATPVSQPPAAPAAPRKSGKAVAMGQGSEAAKEEINKLNSKDEGGTNPDGDDNITAVAPPAGGEDSTKPNDEGFTAKAEDSLF